MKTDDFVLMLATGVEPASPRAAHQRVVLALGAGLLGTLTLFRLRYGVRSDIGDMLTVPLFWLKFAMAMIVMLPAAWMTARLAYPAQRATAGWAIAATPVALVWLTAVAGLWEFPAGARLPLFFGHSWRVCTLNITLLSVPMFAALLWLLRGQAPTQLVLAGAAAGLLAGAFSLFIYSFYCTEMAVQFWSIWYVLGMLIPAAAGALLGRTVLRW